MVSESLGHLFLVSFPAQGHVNPLLRLGKILASKGFLVTFSTTETTGEQMRKASGIIDTMTPFGDGFIRFEFFADGWEEDDPRRRDLDQYLLQLELVGKQVIPQMIKKNAEQGRPVCCLINNPFIPWVTDVATSLGLPSAMLWIQSCACFASYYHYYHGTVPFPDEEHPEIDVQLPCNVPLLKHDEVPSFLHPTTPYAILRRAILGGPKAVEMKENAMKWKEAAEAAVAEGGSSDRNIRYFTDDIVKANESEIAGKCIGSNEFPVAVVVKSNDKVAELVGSSA
ncbi:hypothetical protein D5086_018299 [Populus alba]|uniref:Uncharacterized protein n=1 Tax=Populus alba TaxID=43335 RepID=A0ACC4BQU5_POPAL